MTAKLACLAGSLLLALPTPATPQSPPYQYPLVYHVICSDGSSGTAFRIDQDTLLSVAHVTDVPCAINGVPVELELQSDKRDFSIIHSPLPGSNGFKVNCDGFIPGQWYYAVGHGGGAPWQTTVPLYATYAKGGDGKRALIGSAIPGQSGGPVLNHKGEVVGTVNARHIFLPLSFSLELKETTVCS